MVKKRILKGIFSNDGIKYLKRSLPDIGTMVGVFAKDSKMVLDASLLNTQHYKVRFKGKVEQPREMSSTLPYNLK